MKKKDLEIEVEIPQVEEWLLKQRKILSDVTSIYICQGKTITELMIVLDMNINKFNQLIKGTRKLNLKDLTKLSTSLGKDFDITYMNSEQYLRESSN